MGYVRQKIAAQSRKSVMAEQARERLRKLQAANPKSFDEPLMDYIPRITPQYEKPEPLRPYVDLIERVANDRAFAVVAAPPQHGKTECTMHGLAWLVQKMPGKKFAYATYSQTRAREVSRMCRRIFESAAIQVEGTVDHWYLPDFKSEIKWTSVDGALTGYSLTGVMFIDDPYKSRKDACSAVYQTRVLDWYDDVATKRMNPGSSMIVFMARWDANDLSGQLLKRKTPLGVPYEHINLKAICEGDGPANDNREIGESLWEDRKPLSELLHERDINAYSFASLYQGSPRPRGGALFKEPMYYDELPIKGYRVALGADLAYTKKTSADFSCVVEAWREGDDLYVIDVIRAQVEAPSFALTLKAKASANPGTPIDWYASGVEAGAAQFMIQKGIPLRVRNPPGDKFSRSQDTAEWWNNRTGEGKRLMVPSPEYARIHNLRWVDEFVYEVCAFTGVNDAQDDQVDSLVSACDVLGQDGTATIHGSRSSRRR